MTNDEALQALNLLAGVVAQVRLSRDEHDKLAAAVQTIAAALRPATIRDDDG